MAISYVDPRGFDAAYYLKQNASDPGFARAGIDTPEEALNHYIQYGQKEGRAASAESSRIQQVRDAVARGEITEDAAIDLLTDEQIKGQQGEDYGSLAKAPYEKFKAYDKPAPVYTPVADFKLADYFQDPGYEFRMAEGEKGINRAQAARGNLYSGAALKELQRFTQGLASDEFANTYGRYVDKYNRNVNDYNINSGQYTTRRGEYNQDFGIGYDQARNDSNTLYSRIAGLAEAGRGATNTAANANAGYADSASSTITGAANNKAASQLDRGNLISSAVSGLGNRFNMNDTFQPRSYGTYTASDTSGNLPWIKAGSTYARF